MLAIKPITYILSLMVSIRLEQQQLIISAMPVKLS